MAPKIPPAVPLIKLNVLKFDPLPPPRRLKVKLTAFLLRKLFYKEPPPTRKFKNQLFVLETSYSGLKQGYIYMQLYSLIGSQPVNR